MICLTQQMTEALSGRFEEFHLTKKVFIVLWSTLPIIETDMKRVFWPKGDDETACNG